MKIADEIKNNQNTEEQLQRAIKKLISLYTDKSHFVYELLQNAEDAGATSIKFVQYADKLEVMHNGKAFTTENLQALCDIGLSDKEKDLNKIGEFGIGFKSVYCICDTVLLYSVPQKSEHADDCKPFAVEIKNYRIPEDIPEKTLPEGFTTLFVFPYLRCTESTRFKNLTELKEAISKRLKNLGVTTLLFMKNLELIEYEINITDEKLTGAYLREIKQLNERCTRFSAIGSENNSTEDTVDFIKFSMPIDTEKSRRSVDIAFLCSEDKTGKMNFRKTEDNPYISVFFSTETESKLDFIVQGPFRTTPNRTSVPKDEEENKGLVKKVAELLKQSILDLRDLKFLDLSLIKVLPLDRGVFKNSELFSPLYEATVEVLKKEEVLPIKDETGYTKASHARITKSKDLAELLPSSLLSNLLSKGLEKYKWLPQPLSDKIYDYFSKQLEIKVIEIRDLKEHFRKNPLFLTRRDNEWFIRLYALYDNAYEKLNSSFMFRKDDSSNILDAAIIRTESGRIVAPFRRSQNEYHPNVFLPSVNVECSGLQLVHHELYKNCRDFFENEKKLHLPKASEDDTFIESLKKRYSGGNPDVSFEDHIQDVRSILSYLNKHRNCSDQEILSLFCLKCHLSDDESDLWEIPSSKRILFPKTKSGLDLEGYYKGIDDSVSFINLEEYKKADIQYEELQKLGVSDNIIIGGNINSGELPTGKPGRRPKWYAADNFRWMLDIDNVNNVLPYITSKYEFYKQRAEKPESRESAPRLLENLKIKSRVIFKILQDNERALIGYIHTNQYIREIKFAKIICKLKRDQECLSPEDRQNLLSWNGKWLFTKSNELVSPNEISESELDENIYGCVESNSLIHSILGFTKKKKDIVDVFESEYVSMTVEQHQYIFDRVLKEEYGIERETFIDLLERSRQSSEIFPANPVKNWDALRKHAAEMLSYATPVEYVPKIRQIRITHKSGDARAYLRSNYRIEFTNSCACQLCHQSSESFEASQLEKEPKHELDPLHLCLCENCNVKFKKLRNNKILSDRLIDIILGVSEKEIEERHHVSVTIEGHDLWFTPTHIAEIIELLKLKMKVEDNVE